jgi:hypothetical protein
MPAPPSAKEVRDAAGKEGCDAIPYLDLRRAGKREYEKQKSVCKDFSCDSLAEIDEIEAALERAKACRQRRINVRTIFKQAIGRVTTVLRKVTPGDPLKPDLEDILEELEASQKGHDKAIDEVNNAFLKCEKKRKKLGN